MPDYPHTLPTWRYFPDGQALIVHTREEFDALPPGHEDTPAKFAALEAPDAPPDPPLEPVVLEPVLPSDPDPVPVPRKRGRPRKEPQP